MTMHYIPNLLFAILCTVGIGFFVKNIQKLRRNILMGNPASRNDRSKERWKNMFRIALGQSKMVRRPVAGILHLVVYIGFVIINIEVLEIILDGLLGTHRLFSSWISFYGFLIGTFEILAVLVLIAVGVFWTR